MPAIRTAVFPVSASSFRFAEPGIRSALLPVVDRPLVQHLLDEAIAAGITRVVFVSRPWELHANQALLSELLPRHVAHCHVAQHRPAGLGHAILCTRDLVKDEPFAVVLPDELIAANPPVLAEMSSAFARCRKSLVAVHRVPRGEIERHAIVDPIPVGIRLQQVRDIVETPALRDAPSNLAVAGRYVFTAEVFERLAPGGALGLMDALGRLARDDRLLSYQFCGRRHDFASQLGYLQAVVDLGLKDEELGEPLGRFISSSLPGRRRRQRTREELAGLRVAS